MHVYIYIYIYISIYVYVYIYTYTSMYLYIYLRIYIYIYVYIYIYLYMYMYIYTYMYIITCIYTQVYSRHVCCWTSHFFSFPLFCFAGCEEHREMQVPFRCYHTLPLSLTHTTWCHAEFVYRLRSHTLSPPPSPPTHTRVHTHKCA